MLWPGDPSRKIASPAEKCLRARAITASRSPVARPEQDAIRKQSASIFRRISRKRPQMTLSLYRNDQS
jgi:hypothetical protein